VAKLIFERALWQDDNGALHSYWEDFWPLKILLKKYMEGPSYFRGAYMNDPSGLAGTVLKAEWLHFYLPEDLIAMRNSMGLSRGQRGVGVDPRGGGESAASDWAAGICAERLGNLTFLIGKFHRKPTIENQAQEIEDWARFYAPASFIIEDNSAKGYVWNEMMNHVNGGRGTDLAWKVIKPTKETAVGNKESRFLQMAPRFENGQVLVPGVVGPGGDLVIDPRWQDFWDEWTGFPSGHDDVLDGTFWSLEALYGVASAVSLGIDPHAAPETNIAVRQPRQRDRPIGAQRGRSPMSLNGRFRR
jgi:phage terminase large subunit-like protein